MGDRNQKSVAPQSYASALRSRSLQVDRTYQQDEVVRIPNQQLVYLNPCGTLSFAPRTRNLQPIGLLLPQIPTDHTNQISAITAAYTGGYGHSGRALISKRSVQQQQQRKEPALTGGDAQSGGAPISKRSLHQQQLQQQQQQREEPALTEGGGQSERALISKRSLQQQQREEPAFTGGYGHSGRALISKRGNQQQREEPAFTGGDAQSGGAPISKRSVHHQQQQQREEPAFTGGYGHSGRALISKRGNQQQREEPAFTGGDAQSGGAPISKRSLHQQQQQQREEPAFTGGYGHSGRALISKRSLQQQQREEPTFTGGDGQSGGALISNRSHQQLETASTSGTQELLPCALVCIPWYQDCIWRGNPNDMYRHLKEKHPEDISYTNEALLEPTRRKVFLIFNEIILCYITLHHRDLLCIVMHICGSNLPYAFRCNLISETEDLCNVNSDMHLVLNGIHHYKNIRQHPRVVRYKHSEVHPRRDYENRVRVLVRIFPFSASMNYELSVTRLVTEILTETPPQHEMNVKCALKGIKLCHCPWIGPKLEMYHHLKTQHTEISSSGDTVILRPGDYRIQFVFGDAFICFVDWENNDLVCAVIHVSNLKHRCSYRCTVRFSANSPDIVSDLRFAANHCLPLKKLNSTNIIRFAASLIHLSKKKFESFQIIFRIFPSSKPKLDQPFSPNPQTLAVFDKEKEKPNGIENEIVACPLNIAPGSGLCSWTGPWVHMRAHLKLEHTHMCHMGSNIILKPVMCRILFTFDDMFLCYFVFDDEDIVCTVQHICPCGKVYPYKWTLISENTLMNYIAKEGCTEGLFQPLQKTRDPPSIVRYDSSEVSPRKSTTGFITAYLELFASRDLYSQHPLSLSSRTSNSTSDIGSDIVFSDEDLDHSEIWKNLQEGYQE